MSNKWNLSSGYQSNNKTNLQNIKLSQVSAPTLSIVTTDEAKNYLKIGCDVTDDFIVEDLVKASTNIIEHNCGGLCICEQTWKQYQKGGIETIKLLRQPVIGIPTVSYYENFTDITPTNITYTSDFRVVESELHHVDGFFEAGRDGDGYTITFKTGLFTSSTYNSSYNNKLQILKTAILRTVAFFYENREEYISQVKEGEWQVTYDGNLPIAVKNLIMPLHTGNGII